MSNAEWALINISERRIYPLSFTTTLGNDSNCDIKLRYTNVNRYDIKIFFRQSELLFIISRDDIKATINNRVIKSNCRIVIGDFISIESYVFQVIKRYVHADAHRNRFNEQRLIDLALTDYKIITGTKRYNYKPNQPNRRPASVCDQALRTALSRGRRSLSPNHINNRTIGRHQRSIQHTLEQSHFTEPLNIVINF